MDPTNILVRLVQYGALLPLFGLAAFAFYAPSGRPGPVDARALTALAASGLAAAIASLLLLSAMMSGDLAGAIDPAALQVTVLDTAAGRAGLARIVALGVLIGLVKQSSRVARLVCGGVALASLAWAGHGAGGEGLPGALRLAADILHLLAAGVWTGALVAFCVLVAAKRPDPAATAEALAAFSGVGSAVVAVLIATGLVNLQPLVAWTPWPGLTTSPWGWLLLAKLTLFVAMLALAAANRFVLIPRLRDVSGSADGHLAALRRSLALETGLAFTIAALISVLGTLTPPAVA